MLLMGHRMNGFSVAKEVIWERFLCSIGSDSLICRSFGLHAIVVSTHLPTYLM